MLIRHSNTVPYCQKYTSTDCVFGDFVHWKRWTNYIVLFYHGLSSVVSNSPLAHSENQVFQVVNISRICRLAVAQIYIYFFFLCNIITKRLFHIFYYKIRGLHTPSLMSRSRRFLLLSNLNIRNKKSFLYRLRKK